MKKLGLDIGLARIGVALSVDTLAIPHSTVPNDAAAITAISSFYEEANAVCCYVGLPISLSGSKTASTQMAIDFAGQLEACGLEVRLIDERLTSRQAAGNLRQAGKNSKQQKGIIDASAAAVILDFALSSEISGQLAGKTLEEVHD
jgi:putative Holliday junction resolvase